MGAIVSNAFNGVISFGLSLLFTSFHRSDSNIWPGKYLHPLRGQGVALSHVPTRPAWGLGFALAVQLRIHPNPALVSARPAGAKHPGRDPSFDMYWEKVVRLVRQ